MQDDWKSDLTPFFEPRKIALVGASENNKWSRVTIASLERWQFPRDRWFLINPTRTEVDGYPCYPSLDDVPGPIDLGVVLVNRTQVTNALRQCAAHGAKAVVTVALGFGESNAEGQLLEDELVAAAEELKVLVCGPNCVGLADFHSRACAYSGSGVLPEGKGHVSVISQSGGLMDLLVEALGGRYVGLRRVVSCGNGVVCGAEDFLHYLVRDPETHVIVAYLEGVRNVAKFREALDLAISLKKPIIAIWASKSERAREAVRSHTGSLITSGRAWADFLRQKGVVLVDDLATLVETATLFAQAPAVAVEPKMGYISISGGDSSLSCDVAEKNGVELVAISEETRTLMAAQLKRPRVVPNPLDLQGAARFSEPEMFLSKNGPWLKRYLDEPFSIFGWRPQMMGAPTAPQADLLVELKQMAEAHGKIFVLFAPFTYPIQKESIQFTSPTVPDSELHFMNRWHPDWIPEFARLQIPFLLDYDRGCAALRRLADYSRSCLLRDDVPGAPPTVNETASIQQVQETDSCWLFDEARQVLANYGIAMVQTAVARDPDEAARLSEEIGFPVVMKVDSREIPHRARVGGVELNIHSSEEARNAFSAITKRVHARVAGAEIDGILIQRQVSGLAEVIVGSTNNPDLGPVVMVGEGGRMVEERNRVVLGTCPLTQSEIRQMLEWGDLWRDQNTADDSYLPDREALADLVGRVSHLAVDLAAKNLDLDLNPVLMQSTGKGVAIVDVLISPRGIPSS